MDMFNPVCVVLQNLASDSTAGTHRTDGDTAYNYMITFEFVFILCMMREILEITEQLGQALQKKSHDIVNAILLVESTKIILKKLRSDNGWANFICKVVEFCVGHEIVIPNMEDTCILRGGRARRHLDHFTIDHYFRVEVFRATLDTQLTELNLRFNEKVMDLLSVSLNLIPKSGLTSFQPSEICKLVEKYYSADFNQQERIGLEYQLNHFVVEASRSDDLKRIATLAEICQCFIDTGRHRVFYLVDRFFRLLLTLPVSTSRRHRIFYLVDRFLRLLLTLPVSTSSAERAFSVLKIIKTRLRNKMKDDFLSNNMIIHIQGELLKDYSYEDIIADFNDVKDRKGDF
jgi:hypothetical protein